ncbi:glucan biosynthesis protein G [Hartmannibacter diazotrophicus]|nr:glucan biosynthesis protein G [Hartmannibacter diazotrophicus]
MKGGLAAIGSVVAAFGGVLPTAAFAAATQAQFAVSGPFRRSTVAEIARKLAAQEFQAPDSSLPDVLQNLSYDQYRDIRFRREKSIWADQKLPFQLQLFHRGAYFKQPVEVALVNKGEATHLPYDPEMFSFGSLVPQPIPNEDIGFAGIRIHGPINTPDYYDEIAVFQGASYFRSLAKGQVYGISARGLALKTADPEGEEFPTFRAFWVERPSEAADSIVVSALLDSPSTTGAYRFTLRPGMPTLMDVEAQLFPRVDLQKVGLAPGTSMYFFSGNGPHDIDDFRPSVHDSDGLLMVTGRGERLWRPLANPKTLQISAFSDTAPRGFGLIQRNRNFDDYEDLEAAYQRRPSLWIEPVGDWGSGLVTLIEIPTDSEIHDNIVAYWNPHEPIPAGSEFSFAYRLAWGGDPEAALGSARVTSTRSGQVPNDRDSGMRLFVVDYSLAAGIDRGAIGQPKATVSSYKGSVKNVVLQNNDVTGGFRLSFQLDPGSEELIELRAELHFDNGEPAETWVYRWTA